MLDLFRDEIAEATPDNQPPFTGLGPERTVGGSARLGLGWLPGPAVSQQFAVDDAGRRRPEGVAVRGAEAAHRPDLISDWQIVAARLVAQQIAAAGVGRQYIEDVLAYGAGNVHQHGGPGTAFEN